MSKDVRERAVKELIARLEAATGPDRELDARIWCAVNGQPLYEYDTPEYGHLEAYKGGWCEDRGQTIASPKYTASLDAALTLVPDGWTVARINQNDDKTWAAELREGYLTSYDRVVFGGKHHKDPTPALALCIAAIHARSAQPSGAEVEG